MADFDAETRKDDLRVGTPLWVKTRHSTLAAKRTLDRKHADVVVVGAGISGALVAEALTRQGRNVLILDRRPPVRGSTAASTAMIQHEIDVPLTRLQKQIGSRAANVAWRRSVKAVYDLVDLTRRLGIECSMESKPAIYIAGNLLGARALKSEADARNAIGIEAQYLGTSELLKRYGMQRSGAILSPASASANPAQLATGLLEASLKRKAQLISPVEITDMAELAGGVALATSDGQVITSDHAVFCTGYEYLHQMNTPAHHVTSTWALASRPMSGLPEWIKATIGWEAADPYLYFRTDAAGRIIVGGEDEDAGNANSDPAKLASKTKRIADKFEDLTGIRIGRPAYGWAAPFSVTRDGLPIIDNVPGFGRIFTLMGFGGNGITFSMIGAQIIAARIAGDTDPDQSVFRFR
ncbi:FAD-binding oxidoreductase [Paracoccus sp. (in: a-proteobacteria)]|uniref:NAD(P)/FAD-dependent oxidoreductase n=1 Tax=Paracoccus sp. TaxID=267 RepID=UPI00289BB39C|nr:FAD-binding oxidoreductase [Paracoccus sp. (in: a-proteobacteria)]